LHETVRVVIEESFGYEPKLHLHRKYYETVLPQGTLPQQLRDCYTTFINNKLLCEALRSVASRVLELPEKLVAAWLRGVFDGDGHVRIDRQAAQITISAWNGRANQFIRDALLRVGIVTSRSPRAAAGKDGNIVITGVDNLTVFLRKVGSAHPAKKDRLDAL